MSQRSLFETKTRQNNLTPDELNIFEATFKIYANSEGYIGANDLYNIMRDLGQQITKEESVLMIQTLGGSDRIGFESFCTILLEDDMDDNMSINSTSTPNDKPYLRRSLSWGSITLSPSGKQILGSDPVSESNSVFSSFSSNSSNDMGSFSTTTTTKSFSSPTKSFSRSPKSPKSPKPRLRRETTVYGFQLLKHRQMVDNDNMDTYLRHSNDLIEIFNTLPKDGEGNVMTLDVKNALLRLGVASDDQSLLHLEKRNTMNIKQFQIFFQLNIGK